MISTLIYRAGLLLLAAALVVAMMPLAVYRWWRSQHGPD